MDMKNIEKQTLVEAVKYIRDSYDDSNQIEALSLAQSLLPQVKSLCQESEAVWDLAELLILMEDKSNGYELATRQLEISGGTDTALVSYANLLILGNHENKAAEILRKAALEDGLSFIIAGGLVELALNLGWEVFNGLKAPDPSILKEIEGIRRRCCNFNTKKIDLRRYAYIASKVVILGASEDEGDQVQPYWFFNADEFEIAWILRRLIFWLKNESVQLKSVRPADLEALPISQAIATQLGIEFRSDLPDSPGCLRVFSTLPSLWDVEEAHVNDALTLSLGVEELSSLSEVLKPSFVDIVGVPTSLSFSWQDSELKNYSQYSTSRHFQNSLDGVSPSINVVADSILKEITNLPEDIALPKILEFYQTHRERNWMKSDR